MTAPTDDTPNGLPPFEQYRRELAPAEPVLVDAGTPVVRYVGVDIVGDPATIGVTLDGDYEGWLTPEEALDLAVRLMEVANDARGVPRG